jgi:IS5 family transposase
LVRSERRLCEEVHLNLAYRWFCRLGLDGDVPDHSTFSKNRPGRFRDSDLLRRLFEMILRRCLDEGLVGGESFAVDASLIKADANRQNGIEGEKGLPSQAASRAVSEQQKPSPCARPSSSVIVPMVQPRCWAGWSMNSASNRM